MSASNPRVRTLKGIQKILREFFECPTVSISEKRAVWAVLSALRGPDSGDSYLKEATTAIIRHAFLGEDAMRHTPAISRWDTPTQRAFRRKLKGTGHFIEHAHQAFNALGKEW